MYMAIRSYYPICKQTSIAQTKYMMIYVLDQIIALKLEHINIC